MPSPIRIGEAYYLRVRVPSDAAANARRKTITVLIADAVKTVNLRDTMKRKGELKVISS